ncbi:MAG: aminotransferase class I/II-fold pyridoxal phosphate-dependent enzyme, partial [Pedobacter sp.]
LADEAYYEFDDDPYTDLLAEFGNLVILRTLSKTMGAAGVRLGYMLGSPELIANLGKQPDGTYLEDLNYGIGKATEPGSIFKLATLISLLEDKYVTINSQVDCEGGQKSFFGLRIKDSHLGAHNVSVKEAFYTSSNVAFAKLADEYYRNDPNKFVKHLQDLRLNKMTGIDIVASSGKPTIKTPANRSWSKTTIPYMAHGYEELVTPLHMLMLYNAVANNGKMMRPYLVNSIRDYGVAIQTNEPEVLVDRICSDETLAQVKECLKSVVDSIHGTGHKILFDSTYSISGKTGTAVTALDNKGYNKGNKIYQASFIGYFPSDKPKYSLAVVIQNSRESKLVYGADVSGRVFKQISDRIYGRYISTNKLSSPNIADTSFYMSSGMKSDYNSILSFLNIPFRDSAVSGVWRNMAMKNNNAN